MSRSKNLTVSNHPAKAEIESLWNQGLRATEINEWLKSEGFETINPKTLGRYGQRYFNKATPAPSNSGQLKVLFFDIETAPMLAYIWQPTDDYVTSERLEHDTFMLTWAAKWAGDPKIYGACLTSTEAKEQDDSRIVAQLADMLREADLVVAHNGDRFDIPVINGRLLKLGLEPLGNVKSIDSLKLARSNFRLAYKKLDYLGEILGVGTKINTNFNLWRRCYLGETAALKEMFTYNKRDVELLEQVFNKMKPYVKTLPRMVEYTDDEEVCNYCGSNNLQKRGFHRTNSSTYQRYQCQEEGCKRYTRSRTALKERLAFVPS